MYYAMTIHAFFFLLCAVGFCKALRNCEANPSHGKYVQVGANFNISCIIQDCDDIRVYLDTNAEQHRQPVCKTTVRHEVLGIMRNHTYTCKCTKTKRQGAILLCGVEIIVGYLPEVPQNLTCEQNGELGNVTCTWKPGKETGLQTTSEFSVRTTSDNSPDVIFTDEHSATFHPGNESRFFVSVWESNRLGHGAAREMNVTLSHIVRPTPTALAHRECPSRPGKALSNCEANPSLGKYVQVGANFNISCIIQDCDDIHVFLDTNDEQHRQPVCKTTVRHEVLGIMRNGTYTCKCTKTKRQGAILMCGVDIVVGYLPEVPQNLTCEQNGELGNVTCTWKPGKETGLQTTSNFSVRTTSDNSPVVIFTDEHSATFHPGNESQFFVSVWEHNRVGNGTAREMNVTLSHIVRPPPPVLAQIECSSRLCHLHMTSVGCCHMLEVQHRREDGHHWSTQLFNRTTSNHKWNISISLEPFVLYHFRAKLKSRPHMGLWSHWSSFNQRTEEEAPIKKLDIWYIKESPWIILLWKELNPTEARGKILGYTVLANNTTTKKTTDWNVTNTFTNVTDRLCSQCVITISAFNSRGSSPPANITIREKAQLPQKVSHVAQSDGSIAISWLNPATAAAGAVTSYLVEWCLVGCLYEQLEWQRLNREQLSINITGLLPHECYKIRVYALFKDGRGKAEFDISHQPKEKGPDLTRIQSLVTVENTMLVTWMPVSRQQLRGCLTKYTMYVEGPKGIEVQYDVLPELMSRNLSVSDLADGQKYSVFMTAWTEAGESPRGDPHFFTNHKNKPSRLVFWIQVVSCSIVPFLVVLMCLCHIFSLRQRFLRCCHLLPDMVPDPANSKWAKECSGEKGEMKLNLYLSDSSVSEDEPDTVEVQEMPSDSPIPGALLGLDSIASDLRQGQDVRFSFSLKSPPSTYLKSFSHESYQTQESQNTEATVDYISTQGMMSGESDGEEQQEEEEEDVCTDGPRFLPCPLFDPKVSIGGKLTLDSVKIDCSDFLDEPFFMHC
ncbi:interleukin-12 receptor subunit beta-2 isoform X2 [Sardina pilchardus]|uniref:interleukin-12 receptor subunit beta-2 isoform X2 n=1 Tax=Sardina pilchardus TaxID=27697 RepID=UPI002E0F30DE